MLQLTCARCTLLAVGYYRGSHQHAYRSQNARRAGLPPHLSALVAAMDAGSVTVQLVNTSATELQTVVLQGGGESALAYCAALCCCALGDARILRCLHARSRCVSLVQLDQAAARRLDE